MAKKEIKDEKLPVPQEEIQKALATVPMNSQEMQQMYGDMTQEDFKIPRLVILEGLSPEVSDGLGKPGEFFIKGLNVNLGNNPLDIVVLLRQKSRIKWNPLDKGGGIACQSLNGRTGAGQPGGDCYSCCEQVWNGKEKPKCDLYENFIVTLPAHDDLPAVAISGNKSKLAKFKDFNTMLEVHKMKNRPLFDKVYQAKIVQKTNPQGAKYHIFQFVPNATNALLPAEKVGEYYNMFKSMAGKPVLVEQEAERIDPAAEISGI